MGAKRAPRSGDQEINPEPSNPADEDANEKAVFQRDSTEPMKSKEPKSEPAEIPTPRQKKSQAQPTPERSRSSTKLTNDVKKTECPHKKDESGKPCPECPNGGIVEDSSRRRFRERLRMFISRPIRERDLRKAAVRAEAKKKAEAKIKAKPPNDDFYPREDSAPFRIEDIFRFRRRDDGGRSVRAAPTLKIPDVLPFTGLPTIKDNKDNDGHLFLEGFKPFWMEKLKPEKEDMDPSTLEDFPTNAAVVLEVCQGKTQLVTMPPFPVDIDPYKKFEDAKLLDEVFYTRDIVFGNTIRNIIVNNEESSRRSRKKPLNFKTKEVVVKITEPRTYQAYRYRSISTSKEKRFRPSKKD